MTEQPYFPAGLKGARSLRGTIQGAVRAGMSLSETLQSVQGLYAQQGYELASQTTAAIERQFASFTDLEARGRLLAHVPGNVALSSAWISYAGLGRSLASWNINPTLVVRGRVSGQVAGLSVSKWVTFVYEGMGARGLSVGDLRNDFVTYFLNRNYPEMAGAEDLAFAELAVSAR